MLNEKSQFQKITCCMILFITILKRQHDTNREQISCYQGLARGWDTRLPPRSRVLAAQSVHAWGGEQTALILLQAPLALAARPCFKPEGVRPVRP